MLSLLLLRDVRAWLLRTLAGICVVEHLVFYVLLSCRSSRSSKLYWFCCQLTICAVLGGVCSLLNGFLNERLLALARSFSAPNETEQEPLTKMDEIRGLIEAKDLVGKADQVCVLTSNVIALVALIQYYYELRRPYDVEQFSCRSALFSSFIWAAALGYVAVLFTVRQYDVGYLVFINFQPVALLTLDACHFCALLILLCASVRLHNGGTSSAAVFSPDGAFWFVDATRTRRIYCYLPIYLGVLFLGLYDFADMILCSNRLLNADNIDNFFDLLLDTVAVVAWYVGMCAWPIVWVVCELVSRRNRLFNINADPLTDWSSSIYRLPKAV